jgi:hypothetical protein
MLVAYTFYLSSTEYLYEYLNLERQSDAWVLFGSSGEELWMEFVHSTLAYVSSGEVDMPYLHLT